MPSGTSGTGGLDSAMERRILEGSTVTLQQAVVRAKTRAVTLRLAATDIDTPRDGRTKGNRLVNLRGTVILTSRREEESRITLKMYRARSLASLSGGGVSRNGQGGEERAADAKASQTGRKSLCVESFTYFA